MRTLDQPAARRQGADGDGVHAQELQSQATADDIHDRVQRAELVKMDLVRRRAVYPGFGLGNTREDPDALVLDLRRQAALGNHPPNFLQISFVSVMALPRVSRVRCMDRDLGPVQFLFFVRFRLDAAMFNGKRAQRLLDRRGVDAELEERAENHVAAGAADALEVEDLHTFSPSRLISAAVTPAPNPLSMFTTAIPGTQLLSIARRAVTPCRFVP